MVINFLTIALSFDKAVSPLRGPRTLRFPMVAAVMLSIFYQLGKPYENKIRS